MADTMIERVAAAIKATHSDGADWFLFIDIDELARAAVKAMREPSERMIEAGLQTAPLLMVLGPAGIGDDGTAAQILRQGYPAMIEAALEEQEPW